MNKTKYILLAVLATIMAACNSKKEDTKSETYNIVSESAVSKPDTIKMNSYNSSDKVAVNNVVYDYTYQFAPSSELPIVKTSADSKYYDNTLRLTIKKDDETVYNHTFTKESFKRFIPEHLYSTIVLMGFNFNYNKQDQHDKFYFVASVGDPDDEEYYIPIDVTIDRNGELYLSKFVDTVVETNADESEPKSDEGV